ncbi:MAG: DNA lyase [Spirochaetes bacterium GWB1_27_13]|nr:MAG: DNA lyase [Spirochaetes bacterium GWB1_27_13]
MNEKEIESVKNIHSSIKTQIDDKINYFKNIWNNGTELDIFEELVFCILTPQSKAIMADKAIKNLKKKNLLFSNNWEEISNELNIVRFKNNKARYIIEVRNNLTIDGKIWLKDKINPNDIYTTRDWFVKNIKGYGLKEASHFLRNIGFCEELAILDRHILKNLRLLEVIDEIPKSLSPKKYIEIEKKLIDFSNYVNINPAHLDFVLWYKETNVIFK